jgi:hypothetical protein
MLPYLLLEHVDGGVDYVVKRHAALFLLAHSLRGTNVRERDVVAAADCDAVAAGAP